MWQKVRVAEGREGEEGEQGSRFSWECSSNHSRVKGPLTSLQDLEDLLWEHYGRPGFSQLLFLLLGLASNDTDWLQAKEGKPKMPVSWGYFFCCCSEMLVHFPETRYTVCSSAMASLGKRKDNQQVHACVRHCVGHFIMISAFVYFIFLVEKYTQD